MTVGYHIVLLRYRTFPWLLKVLSECSALKNSEKENELFLKGKSLITFQHCDPFSKVDFKNMPYANYISTNHAIHWKIDWVALIELSMLKKLYFIRQKSAVVLYYISVPHPLYFLNFFTSLWLIMYFSDDISINLFCCSLLNIS